MTNFVPSHEKESKKFETNYLTVSLLPIFEQQIYTEWYFFLTDNNLISLNQISFKQDNSSINQLLLITREIYNLYIEGFEVR